MVKIFIKTNGAKLTVMQPVVTSGSGGSVKVCFDFDNEWNNLKKTAVFVGNESYSRMINEDEIDGYSCEFPVEFLATPGNVKIGVFGADGTRALTSVFCNVKISHGATKSDLEATENWTPDMYDQLLGYVKGMTADAVAGTDAGVEVEETGDGLVLHLTLPKGEPGKDGEDGLTPYIQDGYWWIGESNTGVKAQGDDGVSVTHFWNGTTLSVTSASGTSSANLKGDDGKSIIIDSVIESDADGGENKVTFSNGKTLTVKNGNKGNDGKSIIVDSITESTEDGGENKVTFSDKTTLTVKNGNKGDAFKYEDFTPEQLEALKPQKGKDYFTEEDFEDFVYTDFPEGFGVEKYCFLTGMIFFSTESAFKFFQQVWDEKKNDPAYKKIRETNHLIFINGVLKHVWVSTAERYMPVTANVPDSLKTEIGDELKEYVDEKLGDVEGALDAVIEIQNSLIGGESV